MKRNSNSKTEYFECTCMSHDHTLRFLYDEKDGFICLDYHLILCGSLFKRLSYAFRYIFNMTPGESIWEEVLLEEEDLDRLINILSRFKEIKQKKAS